MQANISPDKFIQMGMGFWASKTLMSAVELGVCTELAKGAKDANALSAALDLNGRSGGFLRCPCRAWNHRARWQHLSQYTGIRSFS